MSKYNSIFYLLFILLVMGAFASMAQNSYGLKIIGAVAFIFGLVFLVELISTATRKDKQDVFAMMELGGLFLLSVIFGFRVFYIHFPYIEVVFTVTALLLAFLYLRKLVIRFRHFNSRSPIMARFVFAFHSGIILFLLSLAMLPFFPTNARVLGVLALILLTGFLIGGMIRKNLLVDGEKLSAFSMISRLKDHSVVLVFLFLLFTFYSVFNKLNLLPGIYSDEFPRSYYQLVDDASEKKEKPVNGKYRHEEFMEKYRQFLEHNKDGIKVP